MCVLISFFVSAPPPPPPPPRAAPRRAGAGLTSANRRLGNAARGERYGGRSAMFSALCPTLSTPASQERKGARGRQGCMLLLQTITTLKWCWRDSCSQHSNWRCWQEWCTHSQLDSALLHHFQQDSSSHSHTQQCTSCSKVPCCCHSDQLDMALPKWNWRGSNTQH